MSESAPAVPEPILPKKRRRWVLVLLACGGAYWWLTRLTPDERVFVGRWKIVIPSEVPPLEKCCIELYSDRTGCHDETWGRWSAHQGELLFEDRPFHRRVWEWVQNGFKDWGERDRFRYQIIDHDKILILEPDGKSSGELVRVIGVLPEVPAEP